MHICESKYVMYSYVYHSFIYVLLFLFFIHLNSEFQMHTLLIFFGLFLFLIHTAFGKEGDINVLSLV